MAKIEIIADTEEGTLIAKVDGKIVDEASEVSIFTIEKDIYVSVVAVEKIDDNTRRIVRYASAQSEAGKEAIANGTALRLKNLPDFVKIPERTKAERDIETYFGHKLGVE